MIKQLAQIFNYRFVRLLQNLLMAPIGLPHELAHYLPARVFGMNPKLHWDSVYHDTAPLPKLLIVTLMPTFIGLLLILLGYSVLPLTRFAWLLVIIGLGVFASSPIDWRDAFYMFRQWRQDHAE